MLATTARIASGGRPASTRVVCALPNASLTAVYDSAASPTKVTTSPRVEIRASSVGEGSNDMAVSAGGVSMIYLTSTSPPFKR